MATAGRGVGFVAVEMIPNGKFANEKWLDLGIGNQDLTDAMLTFRVWVQYWSCLDGVCPD